MTPEERAYTNTSAQIRLSAGAHTHIATLGWVDPRQEVSVTPEERAEKALDIELHFTCIGANDWHPLVAAIADAIRAAIAEEREACIRDVWDAVSCPAAGHGPRPMRVAIEARIRARGQA